MFECNDCGALFTEPETYRKCMGEFWGMPAYEEFGRCPECRSDDFEEMTDYDVE